jgi:hypothetical protein
MGKRLPRRHYSEADKALMWERWQKGESLHTIGRLFERSHTSVRRILAETGAINALLANSVDNGPTIHCGQMA